MGKYFRRIITIRATDSPNVRYALAQQKAGIPVTGELLLPGVLTWEDYVKRRTTWDHIRQCIGLDGQFYEGAEALLYPPVWLNEAERYAERIRGYTRKAEAIGVDPAEGGDQTSICVVDRLGVIELISEKTPDTSLIPKKVIAVMRAHNVHPERVMFDRGGGGREHADYMRDRGYKVQTVGFGESINFEPRHGVRPMQARKRLKEERYAYKNRRAEMYGMLRSLLDPSRADDSGNRLYFGIPARFVNLRHELSPIPLWYDDEGRLYLPPKQRKTGDTSATTKVTLNSIIGHSPDEADALVLAIYGMLYKEQKIVAGPI